MSGVLRRAAVSGDGLVLRISHTYCDTVWEGRRSGRPVDGHRFEQREGAHGVFLRPEALTVTVTAAASERNWRQQWWH